MTSKLASTVLLFCLTSTFATSAEIPRPAQIPDTLASALPNAKPAWVAADVAFKEGGALRSEYFDEGSITALESYRAAERAAERAAGGLKQCTQTLNGTGPQLVADLDTPEDLTRNSMAVLKGTVVASREGFLTGFPGRLLAVEVADRLKSLGPITHGNIVYVFVDEARITTPTEMICAKPLSGTAVPEVGDRVLIFAVYDPVDATHAVLPVDLARTIAFDRKGKLTLPRAFRGLNVRTFDDTVADVRNRRGLAELPSRWETQQ